MARGARVAAADSIGALRNYGYDTVEEVFYAARVMGAEVAALYGESDTQALQARFAAVAMLPAALAQSLEELPCALGVPGGPPPTSPPSPFGPVPGPPSGGGVNHIPTMPPVRNQESRGTCVAHAAISALEHAMTVSGAYADMSEQFLYWSCKQNDGIPTQSGTWLAVAFPLIERDGVCLESVWPYQPSGCMREDCGPPPPAAIPGALPYRRRMRELPKNSVDDIKTALAGDRCVAFSVPVYRSWYHSLAVRDTGKITMPLPNDVVEGGHAMCFVGYEDSPAPGLGGGRFILRNSWGTSWGAHGAYGGGYGSIPYAYIARHGMEAYTVA